MATTMAVNRHLVVVVGENSYLNIKLIVAVVGSQSFPDPLLLRATNILLEENKQDRKMWRMDELTTNGGTFWALCRLSLLVVPSATAV